MSSQVDSYKSIDKISEGFYKEKGSKFLGFAPAALIQTLAFSNPNNFVKSLSDCF